MHVAALVGILADHMEHPRGFPTMLCLCPKEGRLTITCVNPVTEQVFEHDIPVTPGALATLDYAPILGTAIIALADFTGDDPSPLAHRAGRSPAHSPSAN